MSQITHQQNNDTESTDSYAPNLQETVDGIKERLQRSSGLILPLDQSLDLLEQLTCFEFGRFSLLNRGYNGYWTSYFTLPPQQKEPLHPLEEWLLTRCPSIVATRERFKIFQQQTQQHLKPGMVVASIPCGLMDDLLSLDYEGLESVEIVGVDTDPESLQQAKSNSQRYGVENKLTLLQRDAWNLNINDQLDLITSNGLGSYESDIERVIELYKSFYKALRPGGILVVSCSSPPPPHPQSSWQNYNLQDLLIQKAILFDILQAKWVNYRTEDQMHQHLGEAGFKIVKVIYDTRKIILTSVAKKL